MTATEPVFGYMATALGFKMRNERFQLAVVNNTEPRASDVAAFENDLSKHLVQLLLYNSQASDAAAQRMVRIAQHAKVPVVGVTETEPAATTFQDWILTGPSVLADESVYIASESSFHRVLRAHGQMNRRGRARPRRRSRPPTTHIANRPGDVWGWGVTFLPAHVQGRWFYL